MKERLVVIFDEGCLLCSGAVRFLHERDRRGRLWFAGLGSQYATAHRESFGLPEPGASAETFVVLDEAAQKAFTRSDGVARVLREFGPGWSQLGRLLGFLPRGLRDGAYSFVARNRRHWFGSSEHCGVPPGSLRGRVLD
ncbi:MAG: DCC1-like thiol-disulfide oxidoreductase family protein [Verrucomicrobiota bacterium JB023]|nr:DCC1-like thiol-disulfide oxidoreductase family protein [Verrucomicrobiota bacterium JB023]